MEGNIDTNAGIGGTDEPTFSDAEISGLLEHEQAEISGLLDHEQEVLLTVVQIDKTRPGGASFPYLNNTIHDLDKYGIFKTVGRHNYKHSCTWLYKQVVYHILNYKN